MDILYLDFSSYKEYSSLSGLTYKELITLLKNIICQKYLNSPISHNSLGAPYLTKSPYFISTSDTKNSLIISYSNNNHGIDMEEIKNKYHYEVIKRIFNEEVYQSLIKSSEKNYMFLKYFTLYEAIYKFFQKKFSFKSLDNYIVITEEKALKYQNLKHFNNIISIASEKDETINFIDLTLKDLI